MRLHTQAQNSAGERVRIALNLKGLAYEYVSIPDQKSAAWRSLNPQGLMPALEVDGVVIAQLGAILAWLEERWPDPALLPADALLRAQALAFAFHVAAEMHAMTTRRVRRFLGELGVEEAGVARWKAHWLGEAFTALEATLAARAEPWPFCFGEQPGWADLHLIPQMANARRFGVTLEPYPLLRGVEARCVALDAFRRARPESQPDYRGAG